MRGKVIAAAFLISCAAAFGVTQFRGSAPAVTISGVDETGLKLYLKFDDTGNHWRTDDYSGSGNVGTSTVPIYQTGVLGNSGYFSNSSTRAPSGALSMTGTWTLALWYKPLGTNVGGATTFWSTANEASSNVLVSLAEIPRNMLRAFIRAQGDASGASITNGSVTMSNGWNFIVLWKAGSVYSMQQNMGVVISTNYTSFSAAGMNSTNWTLGGLFRTAPDSLIAVSTGNIDEVRFYLRELSALERTNLYYSTRFNVSTNT